MHSQMTVETQRRRQTLSQEFSDAQSDDCGDLEKAADIVAGDFRSNLFGCGHIQPHVVEHNALSLGLSDTSGRL